MIHFSELKEGQIFQHPQTKELWRVGERELRNLAFPYGRQAAHWWLKDVAPSDGMVIPIYHLPMDGSLESQLAIAVLKGDKQAIYPLIDLLLEQRVGPQKKKVYILVRPKYISENPDALAADLFVDVCSSKEEAEYEITKLIRATPYHYRCDYDILERTIIL